LKLETASSKTSAAPRKSPYDKDNTTKSRKVLGKASEIESRVKQYPAAVEKHHHDYDKKAAGHACKLVWLRALLSNWAAATETEAEGKESSRSEDRHSRNSSGCPRVMRPPARQQSLLSLPRGQSEKLKLHEDVAVGAGIRSPRFLENPLARCALKRRHEACLLESCRFASRRTKTFGFNAYSKK